MKTLFVIVALLFSNAALAQSTYRCDSNVNSWTLTVDLAAKAAMVNSNSHSGTFTLSQILESNPPQYIFGDFEDCYVHFTPTLNGRTGSAIFHCETDDNPKAIHMELNCTALTLSGRLP